MSCLEINASLSRKLYTVLAHNVWVEDIATNIYDLNAARIPGLQVQKVSWLRKKLPEGKNHSTLSLLVNVTEEATANPAIHG
jgi:hypothetical protein